LLLENGDCVIVLPGGVGTFDEFWDTVCGKSLGMKNLSHKPVCLVNAHGYYDGFVAQLQVKKKDRPALRC
jgi:predicted Rossmann-fold nucleotide-binding protein